jgi:hypothetical protein
MKLLVALLFMHVVLFAPGVSLAETDGDRAVAKGMEGLRQFAASNYAAAYENFQLAEELSHSPVFVLHMARSKVALGEIPAARELYRQVVGEQLPEHAPAPWIRAQQAASVELQGLSEEATDESGNDSTAPAEALRALPTAKDAPVATPASKPTPAQSGGTLRVRGTAGEAQTWPAFMALGIGSLSLGVGAVTGLVALKKTDDIREACGGNTCRSSEGDEVRSARDFARVSTWSFVIGGAFAGAGGAWLLLQPDMVAPIQVGFRPGSLLVGGSF